MTIMTLTMIKVTLPQLSKVLELPENTNLMDGLIDSGLPVASSCHGEGICSKCVVEIMPSGEPSVLEVDTLKRNKLALNSRLSCQVFLKEDCEVKTTYW